MRASHLCLLALAACGVSSEDKTIEIGADVGRPDDVTDTVEPTPEVVLDTDEEPVDDVIDTGSADTAPPDDTADPGWEREFDILITADDSWTLYIDGNSYISTAQDDWRHSDHVIVDIQGRQRQVVAIHGRDNHAVIAGLIAVVHVSTELYSYTGDGRWKMTTEQPPAGWTEPDFDDSSWGPAFQCPDAETAVWGDYWLSEFLMWDARWIWHSGSCRSLGQAWFRMVVE